MSGVVTKVPAMASETPLSTATLSTLRSLIGPLRRARELFRPGPLPSFAAMPGDYPIKQRMPTNKQIARTDATVLSYSILAPPRPDMCKDT
jgi:hypothetical protein